MNSQISTISGTAIPLTGNDIDTDRIIPARFLRCVTFDGLGANVFEDDRIQLKGTHPFDLPQFQGANVLVVNSNFGCGSSREHAPQALAKWGIQVVIGESFSEIFFGNCVAMGIPCLNADAATITALQEIIRDNPQTPITVDLEALRVRCGKFNSLVSIGEGSRQQLVNGTWDACGQLVANLSETKVIAAKLPYVAWG